MATNPSIDPELVECLLELMGQLEWDRDYDYKSERSRDCLCV